MTTRTVTVKLRTEASHAIAQNKRAEKSYKDVRQEIERLDNAASALTKMGLVSGIAAVPGVLAPAAAAMAAIPGLALSGAAAMGTFAVAVDGMGDAFKAVADGDAQKLLEALEGLSGEAKAFVLSYQKIKPVLAQVGDPTQNAMFRQMRGDLELLVERYLPTMLSQMPRVAAELGKAGHELTLWATTPDTVAKVNRQFDLATDLTRDWTRLLKSGVSLMLDLADAGADFDRGLVSGLADGVESMRRWTQTAKAQGQLNNIFANGGRILEKVGDIAATTGDLLMDMAANPALTDATMSLLDLLHMTLEVVHGMVTAFSALPQPLQSVASTMLVVGGAAMLLAGRVAAMRAAVLTASMKLDSLGPSGERAAKGLGRVASWAGRATVAFAALQVAQMAIASTQAELNPQIEAMAVGLVEWAKGGQLSGEAARVLGQEMKDLDVGLKFLADTSNHRRQWVRDLQDQLEAIVPGLAGTNTSLARTRERVQAVDRVLAELVQNGRAGVAATAFQQLAASQAKYGVSTEELAAMFPEYRAAVESAAKSTSGLADAQAHAAMNAAILNSGLKGAVKEAGSLTDAFDRLHGATLKWAGAEISAEEALDKLNESFAENGKTLDVTTEKGRENKRAIIDMTEAAVAAAQAKYDETVAIKGEDTALREANQVYNNYIAQLRASMLAAGMKKDAVDALIKSIASMPPLISTVTTPGLDAAIAKTERLLALRRMLGSNVAAANANSGSGYTTGRRWGGVTEHARDGLLRQAQTFSAVSSGARYAFAEPATRGEAFIPKNGDRQRSLGIVDTAARWYGHTIAPMGGGAGGGGVQTIVHKHEHTTHLVISGREMMSGFRKEIDVRGGNVQNAAGSRRS